MKAVEFRRYGAPDVLKMIEAEKPAPKDNELLVRIHATTVTATECTFRRGRPWMARLFMGITKPKFHRLGEELAGEIEAVGKDVTQYQAGDKVFGTAGPEFGANAEYICLPEDAVLAALPENLSHAEAAASVDGVLTALPFMRDTGKLQSGQKVLISGASGSVGSAAVQVAAQMGAEVTAVCSGANRELVMSLGATRVIDYTQEDFSQGTDRYDLIFDTTGKVKFSRCKRVLKPNGVFMQAAITLRVLPIVLWTAMFGRKKAKIAATGMRKPAERKQDLLWLKNHLENGSIVPVIDRSFELEELVEAHRYVDKGHKKGNVPILVSR